MRLKGTAGPINCLSFGHDGKYLASGGAVAATNNEIEKRFTY